MKPSSAQAAWSFGAADGEAYEQLMGRWSRRLAGPFLDFVGTGDGERVLDAGCGTGHIAVAVASRMAGGTIHGIDRSARYIAHAIRQRHDARIAYAVADVRALPCADHRFDRVLSMLVLHFVAQPLDAIAELRRVARPGATVGACVWDARGGFVANRIFFDTAAALDPLAADARAKNYTRPMTRPGELGDAWRAAGFTDVVESTLAIRMDFASFADYWAPYVGEDGPGAAYVRTLDEARHERLRDAVRAAYLDGEDDGPRSYAALAWAVRGCAPD